MDKWKTKDGQILLIHEMTTNHLKNAMKMMERNEVSISYSIMQEFEKFACTLNGDIAQMHAESIIDAFYEDDDDYVDMSFDITMYPPYRSMMKELKNRGVDHDPL